MESASPVKSNEFGDGIDEQNESSENQSQKRKNGIDIDLKCTGATYCSKRFKNESSEPACMEHKKIVSKPPLPPKCDKTSTKKRKLEENSSRIQIVNAQCNQLRLEILDLKEMLANEKTAVRALKAQSDAENRKAKILLKKKYEEELQATKKHSVLTKPKPQDNASTTTSDSHGPEISKLNKEIAMLQKRNKNLEEKLQISTKAERQISTDLRELKDSYELRLTQISKSAKTKIHRLLEEIKVKDKQNEQSSKAATKARSIKSKNGVEPHNKENADKSSSTNQKTTIKISTCGNELANMPHESQLSYYKTNKDTSGSDNDSVLSSSPPSLSPQPGTYPNSADIWQMRSKDSKLLDNLQKDYDNLQEEYSLLNDKYLSAIIKIEQLEKENAGKNEESSKISDLMERLAYLECEKEKLSKESHELREQNELLEFRIIELEESHDKWSLRSTINPDTRDMWTDTYKTTSDDYFIPSDRSDSGITSPYNQQNSDDFSHCDLPSIQHDDVRKRILVMTKKSCLDDEDRVCLLQISSLLTNLEAMSQEQSMSSENNCPVYNANRKIQPENVSSLSASLPPSKSQERIIATVQPYSTNSESPFKKARYQSTLSLQESGVFDVEVLSQSTQTDVDDFPTISEKSDLNVEIQKLNKFRKKIEECVTKTNKPVGNLIAPKSCDQQHLQFYKDRLEQMESKIRIYESSGDVQALRLADRLNREIQLESCVKLLTQRVDKLVDDNLQLEEQRCELEEVENDTRLRLQRLEVDLEILTQRNMELQMSRDAVKAHANCLQDTINKAQDRIYYLEEQRNDLKQKMEMLSLFLPTILLYNTYKVQETQNSDQIDELQISGLPNVCSCIQPRSMTAPEKYRLNELLSRERELQQNIAELNRAYNETLESADNLWAQMEKDYKDRLTEAENENGLIKAKIVQLEERLKADIISAQERINQLEESESELKNKMNRKNREHKEELIKFEGIANELYMLNEEHAKLKDQFEALTAKHYENETKKIRYLEEELQSVNQFQRETEQQYAKDVKLLEEQLERTGKELMYIGVSNGELREEVITLENRVIELGQIKLQNEETIKNLTAELRNRNDELLKLTPKVRANRNSLAQELVLCDTDVGFAVKKPKIAAKPLNLKSVKLNGIRAKSLTDGLEFKADNDA